MLQQRTLALRQVISYMDNGLGDVTFRFSLDCVMNGPLVFFLDQCCLSIWIPLLGICINFLFGVNDTFLGVFLLNILVSSIQELLKYLHWRLWHQKIIH